MTLLRLLGWQGCAGLVLCAVLGLLLTIEKGETRHWKKQSNRFEQLYNDEKGAFERTVASYRQAASQAAASDRANAQRAELANARTSQENSDELQARLADARARYERLLLNAKAGADPRGGAGAGVPGLSAPASGVAQASGQDRLPDADRLTATEQAIELDQLIKWVRAVAATPVNGQTPPNSAPAGRSAAKPTPDLPR